MLNAFLFDFVGYSPAFAGRSFLTLLRAWAQESINLCVVAYPPPTYQVYFGLFLGYSTGMLRRDPRTNSTKKAPSGAGRVVRDRWIQS
jgi:hypothetical protein